MDIILHGDLKSFWCPLPVVMEIGWGNLNDPNMVDPIKMREN